MSSITFTPCDRSHPFFPIHTQVTEIESDSFGFPHFEKTVLFWRNALIAAYQAFIGFDPVSDSTSVKETIVFLVRIDARIASGTEHLVKKNLTGVEEEYTDAFAKLFCIPKTSS